MHFLSHSIKQKYEMNKKWNYLIAYTLLFTFLSFIVFGIYLTKHKSMIWMPDGILQHYNALAYYGEYLREIGKNIFIKGKISIPMWDMTIGLGSDILTTLHYYVIGDPLNLLSIFVPRHLTEYLYHLLIFFRLYLMGLSFTYFCFDHKNNKISTLIGSMIYTFCGYSIYMAARHPFFLNPMIYLPMVLVGIDHYFLENKPFLFTGMIALSAISNFYFFYMIALFSFLYALFRFFMLYTFHEWKKIFNWFFRFFLYFTLGMAIASFILLPVVFTVLSTERIGASNFIPLIYPNSYYKGLFTSFIDGIAGSFSSYLGYTSLGLIGVFVIFLQKKKYTALKIAFVFFILGLCIPFIGHVFNGFSYVSNRWVWGFSMLVAYIVVKAIPEFELLSSQQRIMIIIFIGFYFLGCFICKKSVLSISNMVLLFTTAIVLYLPFKRQINKNVFNLWLIFLLIVGVSVTGYYKNYYALNDFVDAGKGWDSIINEEAQAMYGLVEPENHYRIDSNVFDNNYNIGMAAKMNTTKNYFSLANGTMSQFFSEMYYNNPLEQELNGLHGRNILEIITSVKYYMAKGGTENIPYSFKDNLIYQDKVYSIYQNQNYLSLGYTYDRYIPRSEYINLSVTEKQQALLQGVVLDDSSFEQTELHFTDQNISFQVKNMDDSIRFEDNKIFVAKENASLTITLEGLPDSETYLIFQGLTYRGLSPKDKLSKEEWDKLDHIKQQELLDQELQWWQEQSYILFTAQTQNVIENLILVTDKYDFYCGRENFLCNLGYQKDGVKEIKLSFRTQGVYSFDDLSVVCQPMKILQPYIDQRKENIMENVSVSNNTITGDVTLTQPQILCFTLPYSKGWTVFVDGQKQKLKQANTMFMAVELETGKHKIELKYRTPYLLLGCCISGAGVTLLIYLYFKNVLNIKTTKKQ